VPKIFSSAAPTQNKTQHSIQEWPFPGPYSNCSLYSSSKFPLASHFASPGLRQLFYEAFPTNFPQCCVSRPN
jgi:hypothetical protein